MSEPAATNVPLTLYPPSPTGDESNPLPARIFPRSHQSGCPACRIRVRRRKPPVCHPSPEARRPKHKISQPRNCAVGANSTSSRIRGFEPSKRMFSRGSHSRAAPASTEKYNCCSDSARGQRYHFVAPQVVKQTLDPESNRAVMASASPPATPPGGCSTVTWQISGPSG